MKRLSRDRWMAGVLSVALAISFLFCVASDLSFSATLNEAGIVLPASASVMALGVSWIVGHGLHGAAVVAGPIFLLTQGKPKAVVEASGKPN